MSAKDVGLVLAAVADTQPREEPMNQQQMAEAQRTGFALARAMSTGDLSSVADVVATMTPEETRRALIGTSAMTAFVVQRAGLDWDDLAAEMERRLTA